MGCRTENVLPLTSTPGNNVAGKHVEDNFLKNSFLLLMEQIHFLLITLVTGVNTQSQSEFKKL